ncbi:putative FCP1 domain, HAD-like domain-containing protein [Medicago truncatula]|uniref:Putative FCP1 domain, HAD-like domain-containing protein n=1 Tax=Medicago truncatula TaxID=3880 RepID=A0A396HBI4_MEDTR|nr:putative FCP1 domain, HAD-like domain-containing protein [Medicago truncatula]
MQFCVFIFECILIIDYYFLNCVKGYKRPFTEEFMKFCLERFEVGLWSSRSERSIDGALECVMGDSKNKLLFVWLHNIYLKSIMSFHAKKCF